MSDQSEPDQTTIAKEAERGRSLILRALWTAAFLNVIAAGVFIIRLERGSFIFFALLLVLLAVLGTLLIRKRLNWVRWVLAVLFLYSITPWLPGAIGGKLVPGLAVISLIACAVAITSSSTRRFVEGGDAIPETDEPPQPLP